MNASTPLASLPSWSPIPSGNVRFDHFPRDTARSPKGLATVAIELLPHPPKVNFIIPSASDPSCPAKLSGMVIPCHFFMESASTPSGAAMVLSASAPNPENVLSKAPRPVAPMAPAIAVRPRPISSQSNPANFPNVLARVPSPCEASAIVPAPTSPANPVNAPVAPDIAPTSAMAPPMATKPLPISSQSYLVNESNIEATCPRPCAAITIVPAPRIPAIPVSIPRAPLIAPTSVRAPPMATRPRPISSQSYLVNSANAEAIFPRPCAASKMEPAPISPAIPVNAPNAPETAPTSARAPPMATSPRPTSPQSCLANESKADAIFSRP